MAFRRKVKKRICSSCRMDVNELQYRWNDWEKRLGIESVHAAISTICGTRGGRMKDALKRWRAEKLIEGTLCIWCHWRQ